MKKPSTKVSLITSTLVLIFGFLIAQILPVSWVFTFLLTHIIVGSIIHKQYVLEVEINKCRAVEKIKIVGLGSLLWALVVFIVFSFLYYYLVCDVLLGKLFKLVNKYKSLKGR